MSQKRRLLMIGLDAAEPGLVEQWLAYGDLPNLQRLRQQGAYGRLASTADWLAGSPWPTFYTGTTPAEHGLYHFLQWRASEMRFARPDPEWLPLRPFWRSFGAHGPRVVALDVPMTLAPEPFPGVEVSGWATHDHLGPPAAYPTDILDWIDRRFGPTPLDEERHGLQTVASLLSLRDQLVATSASVANAALALMEREQWDLFLVGLGTIHRGGHKLWDLSGATNHSTKALESEFEQALRQVYVAADEAVGRLVAAAGDASVLVFSLHGMGANTCRANLVPQMLQRIFSPERQPAAVASSSPLQRLRSLVPLEWRASVKNRLPQTWQDRLTLFWRVSKVDWSITPAFAGAAADLQGYIHVNRRGREREGIIEPGPAYDQLCEEISQGLRSFVDADTGAPVVHSIGRSDQLFGQGQRRHTLPDLLVRWQRTPVKDMRAITSPTYGRIEWPAPGRNPDGRSGNHRPQGILLAVAPSFRPGQQLEGAHILDLAPTAYALLDQPVPAQMSGRNLALATGEPS